MDNVASLRFFLPELVLGAAVVVLVGVDLVLGRPDRRRAAGIAVGSLALAGVLAASSLGGPAHALFGGVIVADPLGALFKLLFVTSAGIVGLCALRARDAIDYREGPGKDGESAEFYALVVAAVLGMAVMAAAADLLLAYLSLEFVSLASYLLAGWKKGDRRSSEAALKYVVYGGVASGVMLYGLSLLYGVAGATSFVAVQHALAAASTAGGSTSGHLMTVLAVALVLAGFGYKVAAVPFHMWCPDVYEGAPTPVTALLSVGPKAAGFALLIRFFGDALPGGHAGDAAAFGALGAGPWPMLLGLMAAATMTLGNFAAIAQTNVKRLLAYSSIAHAGYLLLGLVAQSHDGTRAIVVYLFTYLLMNLGAFVVVMAVSDAGLGETIDDYRGLGYRSPLAGAVMTACLVSLTGIPPMAGFFGKFYLFAALLQHGGALHLTLALVAILNSAVSLYYYARILKAMYFERATDESPLALDAIHGGLMALLGAGTVGLFLVWSPLVRLIDSAIAR